MDETANITVNLSWLWNFVVVGAALLFLRVTVWGTIRGALKRQDDVVELLQAEADLISSLQVSQKQLTHYVKAIHETTALLARQHPDLAAEFDKTQHRLTAAMAGEDE